MSNPLKLLKEGILSKDWNKIAQGYTALTGENITVNQEEINIRAEVNRILLQYHEEMVKSLNENKGLVPEKKFTTQIVVDDDDEGIPPDPPGMYANVQRKRVPRNQAKLKCQACGQEFSQSHTTMWSDSTEFANKCDVCINKIIAERRGSGS